MTKAPRMVHVALIMLALLAGSGNAGLAQTGEGPDVLAWSIIQQSDRSVHVADLIARYPDSALMPVWQERLAVLQRQEQAAAARPAPVPQPSLQAASPSFDCAGARSPVEVTICNRPDIAALDRRLNDLFTLALVSNESAAMKAEQRSWLAGRNACPSRFLAPEAAAGCIAQAYRQRIAVLNAQVGVQGSAASPVARPPAGGGGPSFDCSFARGTIEVAICGDADLAALDRELTQVFRVASAEGRVAPREQQGWLGTRNACASDLAALKACIATAYRRRIAQLR